jgi:predicted Zn-dependent protease
MQYDCYITMEMQQTHCYTTGTITLLWKCYQRPNMSQYSNVQNISDGNVSGNYVSLCIIFHVTSVYVSVYFLVFYLKHSVLNVAVCWLSRLVTTVDS